MMVSMSGNFAEDERNSAWNINLKQHNSVKLCNKTAVVNITQLAENSSPNCGLFFWTDRLLLRCLLLEMGRVQTW